MLPGKDNFSHHIELFVVLDTTTWELPPKWGKKKKQTTHNKPPNNNKIQLPNCLSTFPFRCPEEKAVLYLSCASLCSRPSATTLYCGRNWDGRQAAAPAPVCPVLWSWGKQNLLMVLPKLPWELLRPGRQPGGLFLPKHTQPRGYSLSTNTAPLFQAVLAEGWVAEAAHSASPSLFFCSHASGAPRP